jgi:hypothetical protein
LFKTTVFIPEEIKTALIFRVKILAIVPEAYPVIVVFLSVFYLNPSGRNALTVWREMFLLFTILFITLFFTFEPLKPKIIQTNEQKYPCDNSCFCIIHELFKRNGSEKA